MKPNRIKLTSENDLKLSTNQTVCFSAEEVNILCLSGTIWITWAGGREKCLAQGGSVEIKSHLKICLQAFAPSRIRILKKTKEYFGLRRGMVELAAGFSGLGNRAVSFLNSIAL